MPDPVSPASAAPPRPPFALLAGWFLMLVGSMGGCGTTALFGAAFTRPGAFSGRDGQGAAGLAALIILVAGTGAVVSLVLSVLFGWKLRGRGFGWALWGSLAGPSLACAAMLLLGWFG